MRSLFARLWLSYLLVTALTLVVAISVSFVSSMIRAQDLEKAPPADLASSARRAAAADEGDALRGWVMGQRHTHPEVEIFFIGEDGHELLNRPVGGQRLSQTGPVVTTKDGASYRMVLRRRPGMAFSVMEIFLQPGMLLLLVVVISGAGCALIARYLTHPVVKLRSGVREIATGNLHAKMGQELTSRRDELGGLARDFDLMASNLRDLLVSKEELLRDISHELRSPLARLRVAGDLARQGASATSKDAFDRIDREVERIDKMIGQILRYSRLAVQPSPSFVTFDLSELVEETVEDARIEADAGRKGLTLDVVSGLEVKGDRMLVASALENVLRNAIRYAPPDTAVEVQLAREASAARVTITDSGPGVAEASLSQIFEPFFRCGSTGGVGLGLTIASRVFALHAGQIFACNAPDKGLSVIMKMPLSS